MRSKVKGLKIDDGSSAVAAKKKVCSITLSPYPKWDIPHLFVRLIFALARLILSPSSNSSLSSCCQIQSRKSSSVRTIPNQIGSCVPFLEVGDEGLASGDVSGDEEDEILDLSRIFEMEMLG